MSMKIEPLPPDLLIAIYAIHKFYLELGKNPHWLTDKERFRKRTTAEMKCNDLEYYFTTPVLWDCASFFFEAKECIERIRYADFIICELYEIINKSKPKDFNCTLNLTEEWHTKIQTDQEKLHGIKAAHFIIDPEEGEALEMLAERFPKEKKVADKEEPGIPNKVVAVEIPFRLAYWLYADVFRCLRFEIKKLEDENNGTAPSFEVLELLSTRQPIDLRLVENREVLAPILDSYLKAYLLKFKEGTLFDNNVLRWDFQKKKLKGQLDELTKKYGTRFYLSREVFGALKIEGDDYKPIETLLVLDQEQELDIKSFRIQKVSIMNKWEEETGLIEIEVEIPEVTLTKPVSVSDESKEFRFGNSITDCDSHYIWKDGDKKNGQTFTKGKRRYIWEYCRTICGQGFKKQEDMNKYVTERLGRNERVTIDDLKGLLAIIAMYSDVPLKELNKECIIFKSGKGIEVKKVPL